MRRSQSAALILVGPASFEQAGVERGDIACDTIFDGRGVAGQNNKIGYSKVGVNWR